MRTRLLAFALAAGLLAGLAPLGPSASAVDCEPSVLVFTRYGVFVPEPLQGQTPRDAYGNSTYEMSQWGCVVTDASGLNVDTSLIHPGASMALGSLYAATGSPVGGCLHSPQGLLGAGSVCTTWVPTRSVVGDVTDGAVYPEYWTDSPWHPLDPTVPSGTLQATADGHGASNLYKTADLWAQG